MNQYDENGDCRWCGGASERGCTPYCPDRWQEAHDLLSAQHTVIVNALRSLARRATEARDVARIAWVQAAPAFDELARQHTELADAVEAWAERQEEINA